MIQEFFAQILPVRWHSFETKPSVCGFRIGKEMNKEQWQKINLIIDRALSIENEKEREAYLKKVCDSERLYQQAIRFLDSIEKAEDEGFME